MNDQPFYTAHARVRKVRGVHRRITLDDGTSVDVGVHGSIKAHYGLDAEPDLPLPVDLVVGAAGA